MTKVEESGRRAHDLAERPARTFKEAPSLFSLVSVFVVVGHLEVCGVGAAWKASSSRSACSAARDSAAPDVSSYCLSCKRASSVSAHVVLKYMTVVWLCTSVSARDTAVAVSEVRSSFHCVYCALKRARSVAFRTP